MAEVSSTNGQSESRRIEEQILVLCARAELNGDERRQLESLCAERLDWQRVYELAKRHSVFPVAYRHLRRQPEFVQQAEISAKWSADYQANAVRNLLLTDELTKLLVAFKQKSIAALPIKGAAVAMQAYGDLKLRRFIDLDLLCRKPDVFAALDALQAVGYELHPTLTELQLRAIVRHQHNVALFHRERRTVVELHWHIVPPGFLIDFPADVFWDAASEVKLNNVATVVPTPENHLILLCIHGIKHVWERLGWICDVAELLRAHPDLDWQTINRKLTSDNLRTVVQLGLLLANRMLGAPLPDAVQIELRNNKKLPGALKIVINELFRNEKPLIEKPWQNFAFNWRWRSGWRERASYLRLLTAPTDGDFARYSFPPSLEFLYYLSRPYRMLLDRRTK